MDDLNFGYFSEDRSSEFDNTYNTGIGDNDGIDDENDGLGDSDGLYDDENDDYVASDELDFSNFETDDDDPDHVDLDSILLSDESCLFEAKVTSPHMIKCIKAYRQHIKNARKYLDKDDLKNAKKELRQANNILIDLKGVTSRTKIIPSVGIGADSGFGLGVGLVIKTRKEIDDLADEYNDACVELTHKRYVAFSNKFKNIAKKLKIKEASVLDDNIDVDLKFVSFE